MVKRLKSFNLMAVLLVVVGVLAFMVFAVPLSLTVGLNIGNFTGLAVSVLFIVYGLFFAKINQLRRDWKKKKLREYRLIAIGFAGVIISGSVEIIWVYLNINHNRGIMICIGLVFLLTMASIKTAKTLMKKEQETEN